MEDRVIERTTQGEASAHAGTLMEVTQAHSELEPSQPAFVQQLTEWSGQPSVVTWFSCTTRAVTPKVGQESNAQGGSKWVRTTGLPILEGEEMFHDIEGSLTVEKAQEMAEENADCCGFVRHARENWFYFKRCGTGFSRVFRTDSEACSGLWETFFMEHRIPSNQTPGVAQDEKVEQKRLQDREFHKRMLGQAVKPSLKKSWREGLAEAIKLHEHFCLEPQNLDCALESRVAWKGAGAGGGAAHEDVRPRRRDGWGSLIVLPEEVWEVLCAGMSDRELTLLKGAGACFHELVDQYGKVSKRPRLCSWSNAPALRSCTSGAGEGVLRRICVAPSGTAEVGDAEIESKGRDTQLAHGRGEGQARQRLDIEAEWRSKRAHSQVRWAAQMSLPADHAPLFGSPILGMSCGSLWLTGDYDGREGKEFDLVSHLFSLTLDPRQDARPALGGGAKQGATSARESAAPLWQTHACAGDKPNNGISSTIGVFDEWSAPPGKLFTFSWDGLDDAAAVDLGSLFVLTLPNPARAQTPADSAISGAPGGGAAGTPESGAWGVRQLSGQVPGPRQAFSLCATPQSLVLFGGSAAGKGAPKLLADLFILCTRTLTWRKVESAGLWAGFVFCRLGAPLCGGVEMWWWIGGMVG